MRTDTRFHTNSRQYEKLFGFHKVSPSDPSYWETKLKVGLQAGANSQCIRDYI